VIVDPSSDFFKSLRGPSTQLPASSAPKKK